MILALLHLACTGSPSASDPPTIEAPAPIHVSPEPAPADPPPDADAPAEPVPPVGDVAPAPVVPAPVDAAPAPRPSDPEPSPAPAPASPEPAVTTPSPEPSPTPTGSARRTWTLDPSAGWLAVVVFNDPSSLASGLGHDHAIVASGYQGTVTWDPADPSVCAVSIRVPVTGLVVDPPGARERAEIDPAGAVSDGNKDTIQKNFRGKRQLDLAAFPEISYASTRCSPRADGRFDVQGTLSVRGVGKQLTVPMQVRVDGERLTARGTFHANATDFGFEPFSNLGGALKNQDRMRFVVDVQGR